MKLENTDIKERNRHDVLGSRFMTDVSIGEVVVVVALLVVRVAL